jgi:hypothetical protein
MVDTRVLEALAVRREGSSPFPSTNPVERVPFGRFSFPLLGLMEVRSGSRQGLRLVFAREMSICSPQLSPDR